MFGSTPPEAMVTPPPPRLAGEVRLLLLPAEVRAAAARLAIRHAGPEAAAVSGGAAPRQDQPQSARSKLHVLNEQYVLLPGAKCAQFDSPLQLRTAQ